MNVVVDMAVLDVEDLQALRLGAQVMRHRAEVGSRPRVAAFFAALGNGVERELARRAHGDELPDGSITLTFDQAAGWPDEPGEDPGSLLESLELLGTNPRLPLRVRTTCALIRDRLLRSH